MQKESSTFVELLNKKARIPMPGIKTVIASHFKMLFGNMLDQELDKINHRASKVAADVFRNGTGVAEVWFHIDIKTIKSTARNTQRAVKSTAKASEKRDKNHTGGWITVLIILVVVLPGSAVSIFGGGTEHSSCTPVSAEVAAYEPLIQKYAKQYAVGSGVIYGYGLPNY